MKTTLHIIAGLLALLHFAGAGKQLIDLNANHSMEYYEILHLYHGVTHPEFLFGLCMFLGLFYTIVFIITRRKTKHV